MLVADFNGDGVDDIFAVDSGMDLPPFDPGQNKLFLSENGKLVDATHKLPQKLLDNHGASFGDIDNNGTIDILVNALHADANNMHVNKGDGNFVIDNSLLPSLATQYSHTISGLIDVDGDGWLDMILGRWDTSSTPTSLLFLNDGTGNFSNSNPIKLPLAGVNKESILDIKAIDLNWDGLPDLAISVTNGGDFDEFYKLPYVQLLVNKGDGVFVDETDIRFPQNKIPSPPTTELFHDWHKSVEVVDLNLDGYEDMVLDYSSTSPTILINDGNGKFIEQDHESMGLTPPNTWGNYVAVGDFNNDGSPDLVVLEQGNVFTTYINQITQPTGLGVIGSYDSSAIYRFFNTDTGTHFYSGNRLEVENILTNLHNFNYEGTAFNKVKSKSDTIDIFRFYNENTNTHFFTANAEEAEHVKNNLASFVDEGIAYEAYATNIENSSALHRFFNTETGSHFYTTSEAEMESVKVELAGVMNYEGIAYYVDIA